MTKEHKDLSPSAIWKQINKVSALHAQLNLGEVASSSRSPCDELSWAGKNNDNCDGPKCAPEGGVALRKGVCWSATAAIEQEQKLRFHTDCSDCWIQLGRNCLREEVA